MIWDWLATRRPFRPAQGGEAIRETQVDLDGGDLCFPDPLSSRRVKRGEASPAVASSGPISVPPASVLDLGCEELRPSDGVPGCL
jgi:hypothetical protein